METVIDFIFLVSKITADNDYRHEIKRHLLLGRKAMANLDSILKGRDITLPTKVHIVKAMVFTVVMYRCEMDHKGCYCYCSVTQLWPTLHNPMDCSTPGLPVPRHLPEFAQVHVHCISDAFQPSYPLTPFPPSAFNLSQHQGLFQWVSSSHQVAKVLEFQLQHQSFQWIFRVDFP